MSGIISYTLLLIARVILTRHSSLGYKMPLDVIPRQPETDRFPRSDPSSLQAFKADRRAT